MAGVKKYKAPTSFSFRAESDEWADFVKILMLEDDTPTAFFTRAMREHLKEGRTLLDSVRQAVETAKAPKK